MDPALEIAALAGTYEWTPADDRLVWSPGLLHIHGTGHPPVTADDFIRRVHPEDRRRLEADMRSLLGSGAMCYSNEFRIVRDDGAVRRILDRGSVDRDEAGAVRRVRGLCVDLTDLPEGPDTSPRGIPDAQARSRELDGRLAELEALYAQATLGLGLLDRELRFVRINRALAEINGFPVNAHIGRTAWDLLPDLRESAESSLRQVIDTGRPQRDVVVRGTTPARPGVPREWREHFYPLFGDDGEVLGVGLICEEVTERVAAERALTESRAHLRQALIAAGAGTWSWEEHDGRQVWSPENFELFGLDPASGVPTIDGWLSHCVHPMDRDRVRREGALSFTRAPGEEIAIEYRIVHPERGERWILSTGRREGQSATGSPRLAGLNIDITDRRRSEDRLRAAHDSFRHLVDRSPFGIYAVDAGFRLVQVSEGAGQTFDNVRPLIGRDFAQVARAVWKPPFCDEIIARFRETLDTGVPFHAHSAAAGRADIDTVETYDWRIERVTLPDGLPGVVCHFYDLSERQRQEERIRLLLKEVNHRAKNMLGLVQAIARRTAAGNAADFLERFGERLQALAAAQDLLVRNDWAAVPLDELVRAQLSHFADLVDTRIHVRGPPVSITPAAAQTLGLAVHELATNAAKHGALSTELGTVDVAWHLDRGEPPARFSMSWTEQGGPRVDGPPARLGFGSTVTTSLVRMSVGGDVTVEFRAAGLAWRLDCDGADVMPGTASAGATRGPAPDPNPDDRTLPPGRRVLVIEDEPLIAAEIAGILQQAGYAVIGPAADVTQAVTLLDRLDCDLAVLDVALGAQTSEGVVDALGRRRIPFVVVTGYGLEQLPRDFRSAPFVGKPVRPGSLLEAVAQCLGADRGH